ncbi:barstar family protein [Candidatus Gracilibacteria bacterium]|nr:barstar family protein [Candidatus Gracilibacteria bacterium]
MITKESVIKDFNFFKTEKEIPKKSKDTFVVRLPVNIETKLELLQSLYKILQFPDYFGFNWDALIDCLGDFHWLKAKNLVLVHEDIPFKNKELKELLVYLDILNITIEDWKEYNQKDFYEDWELKNMHTFSVYFSDKCKTQLEVFSKKLPIG